MVCRDQSEERIMIKSLAESQKRYESLFTSTNEGICLHELVWNKEGKPYDYRIIEVNDKYTEFTNVSKEKATGALGRELYGINEAPYFDIYKEVALTGKPAVFETYFEQLKKHFKISVFSPEYNQFATVIQDITLKKQAEEALLISEERFRTLSSITSEGLMIRDMEGIILDANDAFAKLTGFSNTEELIGKNVFEVIQFTTGIKTNRH